MSLTTNPRSTLFRLRALVPKRPLSDAECVRLAELQADLLLRINRVNAAPVPTEIITGMPGIQVAVRDDLPESGFTRWMRRAPRWLILIRGTEPEGRRRFTLAHEVHHVLMHGADATVHSNRKPAERYVRAQVVADAFAANVLMPRRLIRRYWNAGLKDLDAMARLFNVSQPAMFRRLQDLGLLKPTTTRHTHVTQSTSTQRIAA